MRYVGEGCEWLEDNILQSSEQDNSSTSTKHSVKPEKEEVGSSDSNSRMDSIVKKEVANPKLCKVEFVTNPLFQRRQSLRLRNKPMPSLAEKDLSKRVTTSNANKEVQLAKEEIRKNDENYQRYRRLQKLELQNKAQPDKQHPIQLQREIKTEKKKRGRPFKKEKVEDKEENKYQPILTSPIEPLPKVVVVKTEKKRGRPPGTGGKRTKKTKIEEKSASTCVPVGFKEEVETKVETESKYYSSVDIAASSSSSLKQVVEKQHKVILGRDSFVENLFNSSVRHPTGYESLEFWIGPVKPCHRPKLAKAINNILESSTDTLIKITRFEPVLPGQKIPVMKKLQSIRFSHWTGSLKAPLLPRDCDPKICFPNLTEVYLDHLGYGRGKWTNFFPPTSVCPEVVFPTVKTLKLNLDASQFLVELGVAFPNCTHLSFEFMFFEFPEKAAGIWTNFPRLEYIKIQRKLTSEDNEKFSFDAAFTGFSNETCSQLFSLTTKQWQLFKPAVICNYRKNPSIIQLKNLKQLVLDLYVWDYQGPNGITALSKISGFYAFKLMPELEIKLITRYYKDLNEGLMTGFDSISPFIQSVERK